jgi:WD40 repeat protein
MNVEFLAEAVTLDKENPWPGLDYFDERSSALFHGRDSEISELLRRVAASPVTALFGKSGLGKTSLLRAGVFPRLRAANFLPVYVRFDVAASGQTLIRQIQGRLLAELKAAAADFPAPDENESLWEYLHRADLELWSAHNHRLTPVLVFDQFEELFTLGASNPDQVDKLRIELGDLVENRIPRTLAQQLERAGHRPLDLHAQHYRIIVSLREDFLAELESSAWADAMPSLLQRENRMPLRPMSPAQALQAVHSTAPDLIDEALARVIVHFVSAAPQPQAARMALRGETTALGTTTTFAAAGSEVEPALLSLLCRELNEARKQAGKTVIDREIFAANKDTIISTYYRKSIADLPDQVGRFIEQQLITQQGFRNSFPIHDAIATGLVTEEQIRLLVDRRILRLEERYGTRRVELTHDLLTHSVRENRALRDAEDAERKHREQLEQERRRHQEERERLDAENRKQRRLRRRAVGFSIVSVVLLLVAVVAFGLALHASRNARNALEAAASAKAASESALFIDPIFGVPVRVDTLLALAGEKLKSSVEAQRGLLSAHRRLLDARAIVQRDNAVARVAFSPDGQKLATAGWDNRVILWGLHNDKQPGVPLIEHVLSGHQEPVMSVAFSPDGTMLASASWDGTVRLWDVKGQKIGEPLSGHSGRVFSVKFSPDGKTLAWGGANKTSSGTDYTVILWSVGAPHALGEPLRGHSDDIRSVAFSPDGRTLASGSDDGTVIFWDVESHRALSPPLRPPKDEHDAQQRPDQSSVFEVAFSADGRLLAAGSADNTVTFWDPETRHIVGDPLRENPDNHLSSIGLSPDATTLVSANREGRITLWNLETRKPRPFSGQGAGVLSVAISPDGKTLASSGWDGTVVLWDITRPVQVAERRLRRADHLAGAAFSPDGRILVFAGKDAAGKQDIVALWDVTTKRFVDRLLGHTERVSSVAFSPDGKTIASGSVDGLVMLWDTSKHPAEGNPLREHQKEVTRLAFSPDGNTLASASVDQSVILWDVTTRRPRGQPFPHSAPVSSLAFSPDGATLVTGTQAAAGKAGTITRWDVLRGREIQDPPLRASSDGGVTAVDFSPDGRTLISGHLDGSVIAWRVSDWEPIGGTSVENRGRVLGLLFSPDGKSIATVGSGHTIMLWDAATRQALGPLVTRSDAEFDGVALSPDGKTLATIGKDPSVMLWEANSEAWRHELCGKLPSNLSRSDWWRYIDPDIKYRAQCEDLSIPEN